MSIGRTKNFLKDSEQKEVEYLFYPLTKKKKPKTTHKSTNRWIDRKILVYLHNITQQ